MLLKCSSTSRSAIFHETWLVVIMLLSLTMHSILETSIRPAVPIFQRAGWTFGTCPIYKDIFIGDCFNAPRQKTRWTNAKGTREITLDRYVLGFYRDSFVWYDRDEFIREIKRRKKKRGRGLIILLIIVI